jgi:hypothetical protein
MFHPIFTNNQMVLKLGPFFFFFDFLALEGVFGFFAFFLKGEKEKVKKITLMRI